MHAFVRVRLRALVAERKNVHCHAATNAEITSAASAGLPHDQEHHTDFTQDVSGL